MTAQTHPWFDGTNWEKLRAREETPPFVPSPETPGHELGVHYDALGPDDHPPRPKDLSVNPAVSPSDLADLFSEFSQE